MRRTAAAVRKVEGLPPAGGGRGRNMRPIPYRPSWWRIVSNAGGGAYTLHAQRWDPSSHAFADVSYEDPHGQYGADVTGYDHLGRDDGAADSVVPGWQIWAGQWVTLIDTAAPGTSSMAGLYAQRWVDLLDTTADGDTYTLDESDWRGRSVVLFVAYYEGDESAAKSGWNWIEPHGVGFGVIVGPDCEVPIATAQWDMLGADTVQVILDCADGGKLKLKATDDFTNQHQVVVAALAWTAMEGAQAVLPTDKD